MSLLDQLTSAVMNQMSQQASQRTGVDQGVVEKMLPVAMSAMLGGLRKNARTDDGAESLSRALDNHDGGVLENIEALGHNENLLDGQKILRHILGGKQSQTEVALARSAGVEQSQMAEMMAMAAPALLGMLGRAKREQNLDARALSDLVGRETARVEQEAPNQLGGLMGFLDKDGDGDFKDDLLQEAGKGLLGNIFGRR